MLGGGLMFSQISKAGASTFQAEGSINAAYLFHFGEDAKYGSIATGFRPSFAWEPGASTLNGVFFGRYYYHFKTVSPFAEINLGYGIESIFQPTTLEKTAYTESFIAGSRIGAAFKLSSKVTFDTFFFYDTRSSTTHFLNTPVDIPSSKTKTHYLGLGIGFQIFLSCKK